MLRGVLFKHGEIGKGGGFAFRYGAIRKRQRARLMRELARAAEERAAEEEELARQVAAEDEARQNGPLALVLPRDSRRNSQAQEPQAQEAQAQEAQAQEASEGQDEAQGVLDVDVDAPEPEQSQEPEAEIEVSVESSQEPEAQAEAEPEAPQEAIVLGEDGQPVTRRAVAAGREVTVVRIQRADGSRTWRVMEDE